MSTMLEKVTPLVLTFNESANVVRCLERLRWAQRVIVLDSFSTDDTLELARGFPNVEIVQRVFDTFADQCNHGLALVKTTWVLSMDCDYVLGEGFETEVAAVTGEGGAVGYSTGFRYCINGLPLCSSLYPPRCVLYRKAAAHYVDEGHGHRVCIDGAVKSLRTMIDHDDRKPLKRWLLSQVKYAVLEAEHLVAGDKGTMSRIDRLRATGWVMPVLAPFYCLVCKGLWRSGLAGWHYTLQRWLAECMIGLVVVDLKMNK